MKIIASIVAALALNMISIDAFCAEYRGSMQVSAYVVPAAKYDILHQETSYRVTTADIARGYIDISNALRFSVWTNSSNGYLLTFAFDKKHLKEIGIIDKHNSYLISQDYQEVHMPHPGMKHETKDLNLRLFLSSDTKPGTYRLPLAVMISAI